MLVPLRDAGFLNLLFGELYPWKEHRGTGIDSVMLALPATYKVRMLTGIEGDSAARSAVITSWH